MTAIAVDYSRFGFAIAADGKAHWQAEEPTENTDSQEGSEEEQKIFKMHVKNVVGAYALTGTAFSDDRKFKLAKKVDRSIEALGGRAFDDVRPLLLVLSGAISHEFAEAKKKGRFKSFPANKLLEREGSSFSVASLFFAGYFAKKPFVAVTEILHRDQAIIEPTVAVGNGVPGNHPLGSGSPIVLPKLFQQPDPRYAQFVVPLKSDSTLEDAIARTRGIIEAQCSEQAKAECDFCRDQVGGHVHIATITPEQGFAWHTRPGKSKFS